MIPYASNTGTRRNIDALKRHGWRVLITPQNPTPPAGMRYAIDNGAWSSYNSGLEFDERAFLGLVDRRGLDADWVVLPDIVAGGPASLDLSVSFLSRIPGCRCLLPVQDGMERSMVSSVLRSNLHVGLFLGGSTSWKLSTMREWGVLAKLYERWYHVGRVNSARRIRLCAESGATSIDGTSATRYSCTVPLLDAARRQGSLLAPAPEARP